jgi:hypothetical protein
MEHVTEQEPRIVSVARSGGVSFETRVRQTGLARLRPQRRLTTIARGFIAFLG